jgi:hypothetical protein
MKKILFLIGLMLMQHSLFSNSDYDSLYLKEKDFIAQLESAKKSIWKK